MNYGGKVSSVFVVLLLLLAACGDSGDAADDTESTDNATESDGAAADAGDEAQNACPADGCQIGFESIEAAGDELLVTFDMNFDPEVARNHIHIYWDNYSAAQVSGDAADRGVEQGEWVPTDSAPTYTTEGAVSTTVRGDSTVLCVVAADRDHNVIAEETQVCEDVAEMLS